MSGSLGYEDAAGVSDVPHNGDVPGPLPGRRLARAVPARRYGFVSGVPLAFRVGNPAGRPDGVGNANRQLGSAVGAESRRWPTWVFRLSATVHVLAEHGGVAA